MIDVRGLSRRRLLTLAGAGAVIAPIALMTAPDAAASVTNPTAPSVTVSQGRNVCTGTVSAAQAPLQVTWSGFPANASTFTIQIVWEDHDTGPSPYDVADTSAGTQTVTITYHPQSSNENATATVTADGVSQSATFQLAAALEGEVNPACVLPGSG